MNEKLHCWPGARCEIVDGPNKGAIVVVIDRDYRLIYPGWHVLSLSGPFLLRGMLSGRPMGQKIRGSCYDSSLRPLPDLDDPVTVERDEEVTA